MTGVHEAGSGRATGKLILLGEHAVVHGAPALAFGLPRGITVTARRGQGAPTLDVPDWSYRVRGDDGSTGAAALAALATTLGIALEDRHLTAHAELPAGAGLGSSAALAAACARALIDLEGLERSADQLFAAVQASERVFHGNPSGLDAAVALGGGSVRFTRSGGAQPLGVAPPPLVVAHSGAPGDTRAMVARFGARLAAGGHAATERLARLGALVDDGARALAASDLDGLGAALDESHALLAWFGVSTPALDRICAVARAAGAHGAKLTGGGGGGCAVALVAPEEAAPVAEAVAAAGFEVLLR